MNKKEWYGAKCIFLKDNLYEERVTIWHCTNIDEAITKADEEAKLYAKQTKSEYTDFCNVFHMYGSPKEGAEVYSIMRESELETEDYLTKFYETGKEKTR